MLPDTYKAGMAHVLVGALIYNGPVIVSTTNRLIGHALILAKYYRRPATHLMMNSTSLSMSGLPSQGLTINDCKAG